MSWALKDAPVPDAVSHLILIGLADHAEDDGTNARPSQRLLADYAQVSIRTVGYKIKALSEAGLITRGDQQQVAHLRKDRRPTVWDLNLNVVREKVKKQRTDDLQNLQTVGSEADDLQPVAGRSDDGLQNLQAVPDDGLQNLQMVEVMEDDGLQNLQTVPKNDLQNLQIVGDMEDDGLQGAAGRGATACKLLQTEPSLTTSTKVDVVGHLSNARENFDSNAEAGTLPSVTGNTTTITEIDNSSRDALTDLRSHLIPGSWVPAPDAWEQAKAITNFVNPILHLVRYNTVKREKKQNPTNGEWLRWLVQDEANAEAEARKAAHTSRKEKSWYDVAD